MSEHDSDKHDHRFTAAQRALGERMSDFQPRIVTPVLRQETAQDVWRVVMYTHPQATVLGEGLTETQAIELQREKRQQLGQL